MAVHPVILCGGAGTRLWPTSRPERPKQFASLIRPRSSFQDAVLRVAPLADLSTLLVVTGPTHVGLIQAQLLEVGIDAKLIVEPEGRDSAAAIAAAAHWIAARDPTGIAVVVAADHEIADAEAFRGAVTTAAAAAQDGLIVTFGVTPTLPSSAYGYIQPGSPLGAGLVRKVERFVEKPGPEDAGAYVSQGYLWNSGNFVFRVDSFLGELEHHAPKVAEAAKAAMESNTAIGSLLRLSDDFLRSPRISIDHAVLEKTQKAAVLPVSYPWSDLGAWEAVLIASDRDADGNAVAGPVELADCVNTLVRTHEDQVVAVIGMDGVAVIVEPGAVLVCALGSSQDVKGLLERPRFRPPLDPPADVPSLKRSLEAESTTLDLWRRGSALPVWSTIGFDLDGQSFQEAVDQTGRPVAAGRRLRVQARQIYVFCDAGLTAWEGPWRELADAGWRGISQRYSRTDGCFRAVVGEHGEVLNDSALLYDQAFVLFALAALVQTSKADIYAQAATTLLSGPLQEMRHANGGFREADPAAPFQSNPHMHLLEAALAWESLSDAAIWRDLADELAGLALRRFINPERGSIGEFFDDQWAPAAGEAGRLIWPGHQFEWAWLLERWAVRRNSQEARDAATRLIAVGVRGVDERRNVAVDAMLDDFSIRQADARLWPQTERLKAGLILAQRQDAKESIYLTEALRAARCLRAYLDTPVAGLWRDTLGANGNFVQAPAPASSLYHIACALAELRAAHGYLAAAAA
jgi:mannose-1-phosphate guanylyltransferase/mannose-6-phosphate isomerase